jgi:hypothetical protein
MQRERDPWVLGLVDNPILKTGGLDFEHFVTLVHAIPGHSGLKVANPSSSKVGTILIMIFAN